MQLTKNNTTSMQDALNDLGRKLTEGRAALDEAISAVRALQAMSLPPKLERELVERCRKAGIAAEHAWKTLGAAITAMGEMLVRG